jgi:hypothetical protein
MLLNLKEQRKEENVFYSKKTYVLLEFKLYLFKGFLLLWIIGRFYYLGNIINEHAV